MPSRRVSTSSPRLRRKTPTSTRLSFANSTTLDDTLLRRMIDQAGTGWAAGTVTLRVRYSRGADFSGRCYYADNRVFINIGRHLTFPYLLATNLGRARTRGRHWYRPLYYLPLRDAYDLTLFIYLHELYHLLVKRARRNTRQKEGMCDRFAARYLVDRYGLQVQHKDGRPVPRADWDFQDLDGFVAAAKAPLGQVDKPTRPSKELAFPILKRGGNGVGSPVGPMVQLELFAV